jgi:hypothetical protein
MATYTLINSNVLASSAASVTFSAIPSTFSDLVVRVSARSTGTSYTLVLNINGSSGDYSATFLQGNGSAASSSAGSAQAAAYQYGGVNLSTYTANSFSSAELYFPNYTGSTKKPYSDFAVTETNATAAEIFAHANLWDNTATITQFVFSLTGGNSFTSGSSFYLYGISDA